MEYVGHAGADDEVVVHGDLEGREFRAFWLREGRVVAAMHANDWDATDDLRAAVASGDLPAGPRRPTDCGSAGPQGWRASNSASDTASGSASRRTWASSAWTTRSAAAARSPQCER